MTDDSGQLLFRCLSLDLEVSVRERRIRAFAGVRPDTGQSQVFPTARDSLATAFTKLDELCQRCGFPTWPQSDRFRFAPSESRESGFATIAAASGGYAQT